MSYDKGDSFLFDISTADRFLVYEPDKKLYFELFVSYILETYPCEIHPLHIVNPN